jgi:hypothetical protein
MPATLSRRGTLAVALGVLTLTAALLAGSLRSAGAQQPPQTATGVISNLLLPVTNGFANLPEGSVAGDGFAGVACTGASPRSGVNIPAQVVTQLTQTFTLLRILRNNGAPLNGSVRVNCVLEVTVGQGQQTLEKLQALAGR